MINPKIKQYLRKETCIFLKIFYQTIKSKRILYATLYQRIAESLKRYLEPLDFDEIQALNIDLATSGGGIKLIENYSDSTELLQVFNLFYDMNRTFIVHDWTITDNRGEIFSFWWWAKTFNKKIVRAILRNTFSRYNFFHSYAC